MPMGLSFGLGVSTADGVLIPGGAPGVPEWVPMGAIGFADFRTGPNGNYWDGTAAVTADEMFADDPNYGVTFDSATLTEQGLLGAASGVGGYVTGLLGAAMLEGCIVVATFSIGLDGQLGSGVYFEAYDDPDFSTDWAFQANDLQAGVRDYTGGDGWHFTAEGAVDGTNRFAVELNPGVALTCSLNAAAPISTSCTVGDHPMTNLMFQVDSATPSTCFLQTLEVYPKGYANLQALSA